MDVPKRPLSKISPHYYPKRQTLILALQTAAVNGGEGWVYWQDNAKLDRANGIQIAANTRTLVTIDGDGAGSTDDLDSIPRPDPPGKAMLDGDRIMPVEENDDYLIRFGFMAAMIDPGLSATEENNSMQIEYDVGGLFNVHEARTPFNPDPGPMRREQSNWSAASALALLAPLIAPRLAVISAQLANMVTVQTNQGQKFIEFGVAFAGPPVVTNGIRFYVTPTTDVVLWAPDVKITRLSSPTT